MRTKTIVLLASDVKTLDGLREELLKSEDFRVAYVGDDGNEGIRRILQEKPDMVITDMFLRERMVAGLCKQ